MLCFQRQSDRRPLSSAGNGGCRHNYLVVLLTLLSIITSWALTADAATVVDPGTYTQRNYTDAVIVSIGDGASFVCTSCTFAAGVTVAGLNGAVVAEVRLDDSTFNGENELLHVSNMNITVKLSLERVRFLATESAVEVENVVFREGAQLRVADAQFAEAAGRVTGFERSPVAVTGCEFQRGSQLTIDGLLFSRYVTSTSVQEIVDVGFQSTMVTGSTVSLKNIRLGDFDAQMKGRKFTQLGVRARFQVVSDAANPTAEARFDVDLASLGEFAVFITPTASSADVNVTRARIRFLTWPKGAITAGSSAGNARCEPRLQGASMYELTATCPFLDASEFPDTFLPQSYDQSWSLSNSTFTRNLQVSTQHSLATESVNTMGQLIITPQVLHASFARSGVMHLACLGGVVGAAFKITGSGGALAMNVSIVRLTAVSIDVDRRNFEVRPFRMEDCDIDTHVSFRETEFPSATHIMITGNRFGVLTPSQPRSRVRFTTVMFRDTCRVSVTDNVFGAFAYTHPQHFTNAVALVHLTSSQVFAATVEVRGNWYGNGSVVPLGTVHGLQLLTSVAVHANARFVAEANATRVAGMSSVIMWDSAKALGVPINIEIVSMPRLFGGVHLSPLNAMSERKTVDDADVIAGAPALGGPHRGYLHVSWPASGGPLNWTETLVESCVMLNEVRLGRFDLPPQPSADAAAAALVYTPLTLQFVNFTHGLRMRRVDSIGNIRLRHNAFTLGSAFAIDQSNFSNSVPGVDARDYENALDVTHSFFEGDHGRLTLTDVTVTSNIPRGIWFTQLDFVSNYFAIEVIRTRLEPVRTYNAGYPLSFTSGVRLRGNHSVIVMDDMTVRTNRYGDVNGFLLRPHVYGANATLDIRSFGSIEGPFVVATDDGALRFAGATSVWDGLKNQPLARVSLEDVDFGGADVVLADAHIHSLKLHASGVRRLVARNLTTAEDCAFAVDSPNVVVTIADSVVNGAMLVSMWAANGTLQLTNCDAGSFRCTGSSTGRLRTLIVKGFRSLAGQSSTAFMLDRLYLMEHVGGVSVDDVNTTAYAWTGSAPVVLEHIYAYEGTVVSFNQLELACSNSHSCFQLDQASFAEHSTLCVTNSRMYTTDISSSSSRNLPVFHVDTNSRFSDQSSLLVRGVMINGIPRTAGAKEAAMWGSLLDEPRVGLRIEPKTYSTTSSPARVNIEIDRLPRFAGVHISGAPGINLTLPSELNATILAPVFSPVALRFVNSSAPVTPDVRDLDGLFLERVHLARPFVLRGIRRMGAVTLSEVTGIEHVFIGGASFVDAVRMVNMPVGYSAVLADLRVNASIKLDRVYFGPRNASVVAASASSSEAPARGIWFERVAFGDPADRYAEHRDQAFFQSASPRLQIVDVVAAHDELRTPVASSDAADKHQFTLSFRHLDVVDADCGTTACQWFVIDGTSAFPNHTHIDFHNFTESGIVAGHRSNYVFRCMSDTSFGAGLNVTLGCLSNKTGSNAVFTLHGRVEEPDPSSAHRQNSVTLDHAGLPRGGQITLTPRQNSAGFVLANPSFDSVDAAALQLSMLVIAPVVTLRNTTMNQLLLNVIGLTNAVIEDSTINSLSLTSIAPKLSAEPAPAAAGAASSIAVRRVRASSGWTLRLRTDLVGPSVVVEDSTFTSLQLQTFTNATDVVLRRCSLTTLLVSSVSVVGRFAVVGASFSHYSRYGGAAMRVNNFHLQPSAILFVGLDTSFRIGSGCAALEFVSGSVHGGARVVVDGTTLVRAHGATQTIDVAGVSVPALCVLHTGAVFDLDLTRFDGLTASALAFAGGMLGNATLHLRGLPPNGTLSSNVDVNPTAHRDGPWSFLTVMPSRFANLHFGGFKFENVRFGGGDGFALVDSTVNELHLSRLRYRDHDEGDGTTSTTSTLPFISLVRVKVTRFAHFSEFKVAKFFASHLVIDQPPPADTIVNRLAFQAIAFAPYIATAAGGGGGAAGGGTPPSVSILDSTFSSEPFHPAHRLASEPPAVGFNTAVSSTADATWCIRRNTFTHADTVTHPLGRASLDIDNGGLGTGSKLLIDGNRFSDAGGSGVYALLVRAPNVAVVDRIVVANNSFPAALTVSFQATRTKSFAFVSNTAEGGGRSPIAPTGEVLQGYLVCNGNGAGGVAQTGGLTGVPVSVARAACAETDAHFKCRAEASWGSGSPCVDPIEPGCLSTDPATAHAAAPTPAAAVSAEAMATFMSVTTAPLPPGTPTTASAGPESSSTCDQAAPSALVKPVWHIADLRAFDEVAAGGGDGSACAASTLLDLGNATSAPPPPPPSDTDAPPTSVAAPPSSSSKPVTPAFDGSKSIGNPDGGVPPPFASSVSLDQATTRSQAAKAFATSSKPSRTVTFEVERTGRVPAVSADDVDPNRRRFGSDPSTADALADTTGMSERAARATTVSAGVSAIGASVASPGVASQASRAAYALRVVDCDGDSTNPPDLLEHPLQPNIAGSAAVGAIIASTMLVGLLFAALVGAYIKSRAKAPAASLATVDSSATSGPPKTPTDGQPDAGSAPALPSPGIGESSDVDAPAYVGYVAIASSITIAYLTPNIANLATKVIFRGDGGVQIVIALACLAANVSMVGVIALHVVRHVPVAVSGTQGGLTGTKLEVVANAGHAAFLAAWGPYFDATNDLGSILRRGWFVEDITAACAIAIASELPPIGGSCSTSAVVLLVCALAHLGYQVAVRPFQRRLDTAFGLVWAVNVAVIGACAVVLTRDRNHDLAADVLGYTILVQSASFFVQPAIAMAWSLILWQRRRDAEKAIAFQQQQQQQSMAAGTQPLLAGVPEVVVGGRMAAAAATATAIPSSNGAGQASPSAASGSSGPAEPTPHNPLGNLSKN